MSKVRQEETLTPLKISSPFFSSFSPASPPLLLLSFCFSPAGNMPLSLPPTFSLLPWLPYWFTRYPAVTFLWRRFPAEKPLTFTSQSQHGSFKLREMVHVFFFFFFFTAYANVVKVKGWLQPFWTSDGVMNHFATSDDAWAKGPSAFSESLIFFFCSQTFPSPYFPCSHANSTFPFLRWPLLPWRCLRSEVYFNWGERMRDRQTQWKVMRKTVFVRSHK